jgi:hypothetical protein
MLCSRAFAGAAAAGAMSNIHNLKAAYGQAIGHPTSAGRIYHLLTPAWLAQTDVASVSPQAHRRGSKRF